MSATASSADNLSFELARQHKRGESRPSAGKKRISFDTTTKIQYQRERGHNNGGSKGKNKQQQQQQKQKQSKDGEDGDEEDESKGPPGDDDSENQGFGQWLHSANGADTMKLFVLANSMLIFVTMAWPHIEHLFRRLVYGDDDYY